MSRFQKNGNIYILVTYGDVIFDPTETNDWNIFVIVLDELSNAAFRLSLRCLGVELDGGGVNPSPRPDDVLRSEHRPGAGYCKVKFDPFFIIQVQA